MTRQLWCQLQVSTSVGQVTTALILSDAGEVQVIASSNFGEFGVEAAAFGSLTGWVLKPAGLCKDDLCVPVRNPQVLSDGENINIAEFARITNRNILIDSGRKIVALGDQATSRAQSMATLDAPNFTLPDINGKLVSFYDYNRRKRLLLAWSSW